MINRIHLIITINFLEDHIYINYNWCQLLIRKINNAGPNLNFHRYFTGILLYLKLAILYVTFFSDLNF